MARENATLVHALRRATQETRGFSFAREDGDVFRSHRQLAGECESFARKLGGLGLRKGDRLGLVISDQQRFVTAFAGCLWAGVIPVPMYPSSSRGRLESYRAQLARIASQAKLAALLSPRSELEVELPVGMGRLDWADIEIAPEAGQLPEVGPDDVAFLQFTSGSTASPKGVVVSHRALVDNACGIVEAIDLSAERDVAVSWLPMYHDMGLIGFVVLPLLFEGNAWFLPTITFGKHPSSWIDLMHRTCATVSCAPNFAYQLLAMRATEEQLAGWDLSAWRIAACGAEPVDAGVMQGFTQRFARARLRPDVMLPCYGLAEATVAVTLASPGAPLSMREVDARQLQERGVAIEPDEGAQAVLRFVSCGRPIAGHELRVVDEHGAALPECREGEILVRGPSVAAGYFEAPEASAETFRGGWLYTGDRGFLRDGQLYVCGRSKDLIILNGCNYHPQEVEWAVARVPEVGQRAVVAFSCLGRTGQEQLVIMVEGRQSREAAIQKAVVPRVRAELGLRVAEVLVTPPGTLPRTTSGKLRRRAAREAYLRSQLAAATMPLGGSEGTA
jgi:fatty-acyl-CoA synthase